jgi:hypothetical protein
LFFSLEESEVAGPLLVTAIPAPNHRLLVTVPTALYRKELRLTFGLAGPALRLLFLENVEYFNTTENGRGRRDRPFPLSARNLGAYLRPRIAKFLVLEIFVDFFNPFDGFDAFLVAILVSSCEVAP